MTRLGRELTRASRVLCLLVAAAISEAQELRTARIGDLTLEQGGGIRDCVIGYRTFGKLDTSKSNAVLFPTALGWRSGGIAARVGPGKRVDSTKY
jgi:homoserine O-acetyltransferase